MWINRDFFNTLTEDHGEQIEQLKQKAAEVAALVAENRQILVQKAKDDLTMDWLRHRVNALEKQNTVLLQKATGLAFATPEIVPTRPGTMTVPDFAHLPSFEDVGDDEAVRLGIRHTEDGEVSYSR